MEKRGQLTIFIIIGIVILVILGVVFFVLYVPSSARISPEEFSDVQKYVDKCVDTILKDAVNFCGSDVCLDYSNNISDYIKSYLPLCTNFASDFPNLEIIPKGTLSVTVSLSADNSLISTVVYYPITVKKGDMIKTLDRFYAEMPLVETFACIPVLVDSNCIATQEKTFNVNLGGWTTTLTVHVGDDLRVYGDSATCPAC